ncbi:hypothetical protein [Streptomyces sp. HNM0574]|uniref:hypothetical protein n=1 Tax=Streptomyces sp. HNM0574 TaxID=2714954 RepID=UPI00146CA418|nr:hypothetical protein [Streptomyces sp. HNM0574]NLU70460.1 hypothetical protein [Streptomyces sp. HNM0574]
METNGEAVRPSAEEARAALAGTDRVRASVAARSATPWPVWFVVITTAMLVVLPVTLGGVLAEPEWLMPQWAWTVTMFVSETVFLALFAVAGRRWRARTGVALRMDVLPRHVTLPAIVGLPVLVLGSGYAFRYTGQPLWLFAAAAVGAAVSLAFHLRFVHLHRKAS